MWCRPRRVFDILLGDNLAGRKEHIAQHGAEYLDDLACPDKQNDTVPKPSPGRGKGGEFTSRMRARAAAMHPKSPKHGLWTV